MNRPLSALIIFAAAVAGLPGQSVRPAATGQLQLRFTERSPLGSIEEVCRRLDINLASRSLAPSEAAQARQEYDLGSQSLEAFVPATYRPDVPHGLVVWVGVGPVPPAWFGTFSRHGLLCVSANAERANVGFIRLRLPLDAAYNITKLYSIDTNRTYIAGFSAGGGVAAHLLCGFPDVFRGGYLLMGGRFCVARKNQIGKWEPTLERLSPRWKGSLDQVRKDTRLVLMRAGGDPLYSPAEDIAQYQDLLLDGFQRVQFIVLPGGGHNLPNAFWFEKGITALDSTLRGPLAVQPTSLLGENAQAQRVLATAQLCLERNAAKGADKSMEERYRKSSRERARKYLQQVLSEYPATPAADKARQLLDGKGVSH